MIDVHGIESTKYRNIFRIEVGQVYDSLTRLSARALKILNRNFQVDYARFLTCVDLFLLSATYKETVARTMELRQLEKVAEAIQV